MVAKQRTVEELMISEVVTLEEQQSLPLAQELMNFTHVRHLPVVDRGGVVVGIVSRRDILRAQIRVSSERRKADIPGTSQEYELGVPVAKVMSGDVITVTPDTLALAAGELLTKHQVGCLPVVDEERKLVGIVTEADFLQFAMRSLRSEAMGIKQESRTAKFVRRSILTVLLGVGIPLLVLSLENRRMMHVFKKTYMKQFQELRDDQEDNHDALENAVMNVLRKYQGNLLKWSTKKPRTTGLSSGRTTKKKLSSRSSGSRDGRRDGTRSKEDEVLDKILKRISEDPVDAKVPQKRPLGRPSGSAEQGESRRKPAASEQDNGWNWVPETLPGR